MVTGKEGKQQNSNVSLGQINQRYEDCNTYDRLSSKHSPVLHVYFSDEPVEVSCHHQLLGEQAEAQRLKATALQS